MQNKILNLIKKYTSHDHIKLTSRGNTSIFSALYCARKINNKDPKQLKPILTPDQGGWVTYLKYPKMLGMGINLCKTDDALIDLEELKEQSKNCTAFLYAQPGGYFVDQPIKEIYNICKKNDCLVIMDVTGSIGTDLCNGKYADYIVCSFGNYKPIDLGYGGFVSSNDKELIERPKEIFNTDKFDNDEKLPLLFLKLKSLKQRYKLFDKNNKKIKQDLKDFEIIHKNKKGINVLVKFKDEMGRNKLINYCETNNFKYKLCKKVSNTKTSIFSFIKVNENAISIEVQRLKTEDL